MTKIVCRRRRKAPPVGPRVVDLPDALLVEVTRWLPSPSRALFAVALTASTSRKRGGWLARAFRPLSKRRGQQWSQHRQLTLSSQAIVDAYKWDDLDFGEIAELARRLSDEDIAAALLCIDAATRLRHLKLTGCANVRTGRGMDPLIGSTALEFIDFGESGKLSDRNVKSFLEGMVGASNHSLRHVRLPSAFEVEELDQFLASSSGDGCKECSHMLSVATCGVGSCRTISFIHDGTYGIPRCISLLRTVAIPPTSATSVIEELTAAGDLIVRMLQGTVISSALEVYNEIKEIKIRSNERAGKLLGLHDEERNTLWSGYNDERNRRELEAMKTCNWKVLFEGLIEKSGFTITRCFIEHFLEDGEHEYHRDEWYSTKAKAHIGG